MCDHLLYLPSAIISVAGTDYEAQSIDLEFAVGSVRECHTVDILQDDECECKRDYFFSDLAYVSGVVVSIVRPTARVLIDDDDELECGE